MIKYNSNVSCDKGDELCMIDLHSHFLPGIDDGAKTVDESIAMLTDSFFQGVKTIVATPHCALHDNESVTSFLSRRSDSLDKILNAIRKNPVDIPDIRLGAEIYLDNDITEYDDLKKLCIEDTNYMLIEFPHIGFQSKSAEWLYELTLLGIKPIIAHIDRYAEWEEIFTSLADIDVVYQVNSSNFTNLSGRIMLHRLFKYEVPFIASSDMHNMNKRPSCMGKAYLKSKKSFKTLSEDLFINNAQEILRKA